MTSADAVIEQALRALREEQQSLRREVAKLRREASTRDEPVDPVEYLLPSSVTEDLIADPPWIAPTLAGTWANTGGARETAGYRRSATGEVELKGTIGGGAAVPGTLFTLPAGYRPAATRSWPVMSNGVFGYVDIASTGVVTISAGSTVSVALDPIHFTVLPA